MFLHNLFYCGWRSNIEVDIKIMAREYEVDSSGSG
jgi:hypothetical protein